MTNVSIHAPLVRVLAVTVASLVVACGSAPAAIAPAAADPALAELRIDYATYSPPSLVLKKQGWVEDAFKGTAIKSVYSAGSSNALKFLLATAHDFRSTSHY